MFSEVYRSVTCVEFWVQQWCNYSESTMGAGVSRSDETTQTNIRAKVQAVTAFESAGRKHREKRKFSLLDKRKSKQNGKHEETKPSGWDRAREKSLSKHHVKDTSLRLSDFNKVTRKMQLDEDDFKPMDIPYLSTEKVGACYYSNIFVSDCHIAELFIWFYSTLKVVMNVDKDKNKKNHAKWN